MFFSAISFRRLHDIVLVLDDGLQLNHRDAGLRAFGRDHDATLAGKLDREAVPADGDETELDNRYILSWSFCFFWP